MENFAEKFNDTELSEYAERLDDIVEMYQNHDIDKDTARELIEDIKLEQEVEAKASSMQIRSDFIKAADLLLKVL